jgi:hypothetical protein
MTQELTTKQIDTLAEQVSLFWKTLGFDLPAKTVICNTVFHVEPYFSSGKIFGKFSDGKVHIYLANIEERGKRIDIVMAHEFGHYLGIGDNDGDYPVMVYLQALNSHRTLSDFV